MSGKKNQQRLHAKRNISTRLHETMFTSLQNHAILFMGWILALNFFILFDSGRNGTSGIFCTAASQYSTPTSSTITAAVTASDIGSRNGQRPVVGILSQPRNSHTLSTDAANETHHYIAASYVKWIESAGAISIPIPYDADEPLIREIFSQINGILFPGGDSALPPGAQILWDLAWESNARGDYFPVWGTCLGFEFLIMLVGGMDALQTGYVSHNVSLPLVFPTEEDVIHSNGVFSKQSVLYPETMQYVLATQNITMNNHVNGITPQRFLGNYKLRSEFYITSTNVDQNGEPFVSTIESIRYPIYGVQYHPEKNNFEYGLQPGTSIPYEAISHTDEAVQLSLHLAHFFGNCLRKSSIGEYTLVERHPVMIDYPIVKGVKFEQEYIIPPASHWNNSASSADEDLWQHTHDEIPMIIKTPASETVFYLRGKSHVNIQSE
jgi:gamma-glutamyl hydrolase